MHVCAVSNSTEIMLGQHFLTEVAECLNYFNFGWTKRPGKNHIIF